MKCDLCQINEADNQTPTGDYFCSICEKKFMDAMKDEKKMGDFMAAMDDEKRMGDFITAFRGVKRID